MNKNLWQMLEDAVHLSAEKTDTDGVDSLIDRMSDNDLAEVAQALEAAWPKQSSCE